MFCLLDNKLSKIFRYYEAIYEKRSKTPSYKRKRIRKAVQLAKPVPELPFLRDVFQEKVIQALKYSTLSLERRKILSFL